MADDRVAAGQADLPAVRVAGEEQVGLQSVLTCGGGGRGSARARSAACRRCGGGIEWTKSSVELRAVDAGQADQLDRGAPSPNGMLPPVPRR